MKKTIITLLFFSVLLTGCGMSNKTAEQETNAKNAEKTIKDYKNDTINNDKDIFSGFINKLSSKQKVPVLDIAYKNSSTYVAFIGLEDGTFDSLDLDKYNGQFLVRYKKISNDGKDYIQLVENVDYGNNEKCYVVDIYLGSISSTTDRVKTGKNAYRDDGLIKPELEN